MVKLNFSEYCSSFLKDPTLGSKVFFLDKTKTFYTYEQLIQSALNLADNLKNSPDNFFALKIQSSYRLFTLILAALFAQKDVLILSEKEPSDSILRIQEKIVFTRILTDADFEIEINDKAESHFLESSNIPNNELPAFFIMSSGSSGPPKAIPLSLTNIYSSAKSLIDFFKMDSSDTTYLNLPHHHIGGLMILWRAFFSMGKVTMNESDDYQFISLVPLQLQRMLFSQNKAEKLLSCRAVLIGGAPLEDHLKLEAKRLKVPIYETYGMSETCSLIMINGRPMPGQQIKLDHEGHFLIKGLTLSKSVLIDDLGFYRTQDVGFLKNDGTYSFKHRSDLLFKSAGELINPLELESRARELDWIEETVVVPIKHHVWTQAAVMVYKITDSKDKEFELKEHLKKYIHPHLVPKFFIKVSKDIIPDGIKPRRFEISHFAQEYYFKSLFYFQHIAHAKSKRLIVFFHGFMEDHTDLIPMMDNQEGTSYLFIDLPGHGKSGISSFKTRSDFFLELSSLINFYQLNNSLIFYGYSMGGRVALELCLRGISPELLILESSHFGLKSQKEKEIRLASDRSLFPKNKQGMTDFFHDWYSNPIFGNYNKSLNFPSDIEKKISHDPQEWLASLEFFSPGVFPFESKIVIEKLAKQKIAGIVGSKDLKYLAHFKEMSSNLPGLSLYEIDNCGHNPHKTHLQEVKRILKEIT